MNELKNLRYAKGITQQQLADAIGVTRQTVVNMEACLAPSESAIKACRFFGVSPFDVFDAEDVLIIKPRTKDDAVKLISSIKEKYL